MQLRIGLSPPTRRADEQPPTVVVVHVDADVVGGTVAGNGSIEGNPDIEITFTSPYGRTLSSRPRPLDPTVRRRAQEATGTDPPR